MKKILSLLKSGENYQIFVKIIQFDPSTLYKIDFLCTKKYSFQMYQRCSLDDVVLQSKRLSSQISPTKLKSVLVNLARSPDSFVLLRRCEISKAPMKTSKNLAWHGSLNFFCYIGKIGGSIFSIVLSPRAFIGQIQSYFRTRPVVIRKIS